MFDFLKEKNWEKYTNKETIIRIGIPVCVLLLTLSIFQNIRFADMVTRIDRYNEGLVDEVGGFRGDIKTFGDDLNEMRNFLLLPTKNYSFVSKNRQENVTNPETASETEVALYRFIENLITEKKTAENTAAIQAAMESLPKNTELIAYLKEQGLTMGKPKEADQIMLFDILADTEVHFTISGDFKSGLLRIDCLLGGSILKGSEETKLPALIMEFIDENRATLTAVKEKTETTQAAMADMLKSEEMTALFDGQGLHMAKNPQEDEQSIMFPIVNREEAVLLTLAVKRKDGSVTLNGETVNDLDSLRTILPAVIGGIDGRTSEEKRMEETKKEIESVLKDDAFVSMLEALGYKATTEPREDYNKLLYDVAGADGKVQFSFVIELSSGMVKILKENREIDIFSSAGETAKKKL